MKYLKLNNYLNRLSSRNILKDSLWAVLGNGLGSLMLLLSSIIVARLLGKELYGEYSALKNVLLYLGGFASFGIGETSTRMLAENVSKGVVSVYGFVKSVLKIPLIISLVASLFLFVFAEDVADLMEDNRLAWGFRYFSLILVSRAMVIVETGVLSGLKRFQSIGINNVVSGIIIILLSYPLTITYGLFGAYIALLSYWMTNLALNLLSILKACSGNEGVILEYRTEKVINAAFPIFLQDISEYLGNFLLLFIFARLASLGEYGIFSVAMQWNAIILFIPSLLINVFLSYLSSENTLTNNHDLLLRKMVLANLLFSALPFVAIIPFTGLISSFYGNSFKGLEIVIDVCLFSSVFICVSQVFKSHFISINRNWNLFIAKFTQNLFVVVCAYLVLKERFAPGAALSVSFICLIGAFLNLIIMFLLYKSEKMDSSTSTVTGDSHD